MHTLVVLLLSFSAFLLSTEAQKCDATTLCPAAAPCCSEFGYCGTGSQFCLGGCNPFQSHTVDSCKPSPICESTTYTFKNESRILTNSSLYDGDATKYDWTLDGGQISVENGELSMLLTETNAGVRLSSTRFVHYGTITATLKTGRWNGVVAGFITMSNIRDEIDWEFPGAATTEGQTNYFWQGDTTGNHGGVSKGLSDTYENYHDFTLDWSPGSLIFKINGKTVRTVKEADTIVSGVSQFPNTPSRIQLSLWPAGTNASAPGTITWAKGLINWGDPDYAAAGGHFTARVKSVSVKCADPSPPGSGAQGYVYAGETQSGPTIFFTDESTVMGSANASESAGASASLAASSSVASLPPLGTADDSSAVASAPAATSSASLASAAIDAGAPSTADASPPGTSIVGNLAVATVATASTASDLDSSDLTTGSPNSPVATTLGDDAVSAAPTSFAHDGPFFGNGAMNASSVPPIASDVSSVSVPAPDTSSLPASSSVSGSNSLSLSATGTPTMTESASGSSASASASPSKTGLPSAAARTRVPQGITVGAVGYSVLAAIFMGLW
ncbi:concanavalin A-like lectin/glucanase domain-containing protein [Mycena pura]|uniref:Concanavalin A-like lectin/glucanase domain-containing protein n=1 Tax=Mycena pura TaxID=153505 RepID=A0AAD6VRT4_9AGAR|nr:concanavalin A-like lectin/glucanase domain-containing protein [Mycena pura]